MQCTKTSDPPSRVLVAGFGSIGRRHLANLRKLLPSARLTVWRQHTPVSASDSPPAGADAVVGTLGEALATEPEAVIVAGPASTHIETALPFAEREAHVFVEKPISNRLEGLDPLVEICRTNRRVLMVGYVLRFSPVLLRMKQLLESNAIGAVRSARIEVGQYLPDWRPGADYRQGVSAQSQLGGGALLELSHEIDYARWLFGEVMRVTCLAEHVSNLEIDVEDVAELVLSFSGTAGRKGPIASVHLDFLQRTPSRTCQIIGDEGTIRADLIRQVIEVCGERVPVHRDSAETSDPYIEQFRCFFDCIHSGTSPPVDGTSARHVLEVVLAAKRSSQTGTRQTLSSLLPNQIKAA